MHMRSAPCFPSGLDMCPNIKKDHPQMMTISGPSYRDDSFKGRGATLRGRRLYGCS
jgi:hypothetical protein